LDNDRPWTTTPQLKKKLNEGMRKTLFAQNNNVQAREV